ncbi:MAG: peptide-methionine (S)-S-oxide reductase MsrA, partial [Bacteroidales bacterium]|nr:peptide-methionine (S)-S-oxide reductase MsrA [Bacteroidales bacterium]
MIRKGVISDVPRLMEIVAGAQARLKAAGVDQWQDGYPTANLISSDIEKGNCYVLQKDSAIEGFAVIIFADDPNYSVIRGEWLSQGIPYCVIHRMAVAEESLRCGIGRRFYLYAEQLCAERGIEVLRVDTHKDNLLMRHLISRMGYQYCGVINLASGAERLAFEKHLAHAVFAGGCFWGMEYWMKRLEGVFAVTPGYSGGFVKNPTYQEVKAHGTGHYEVVRVTYDPSKLTYRNLVRYFFEIHDPCQADGQGIDIGPQYRSAIFVNGIEQEKIALEVCGTLRNYGYRLATA